MDTNIKICSVCGEVKALTEYHKDKQKSDGLRPECKKCKSARDAVWRKNNLEKKREADREYCRKNAESNRKRALDWHYANRDKHIRSMCEYVKQRKRTDKEFVLREAIRTRICDTVRAYVRRRIYKQCTKEFHEIVGSSAKYLCEWIESQFTEGMTWDNYGSVWHVDHVKPCCSFNMLDENDVKRCFHWSNHQPLFKRDNLSKHGKVIPEMISRHQEKVEHYLRTKGSPQRDSGGETTNSSKVKTGHLKADKLKMDNPHASV